VPASVPVPFELAVKVIPAGNVPVRLTVGVGLPVAVTVKLNGVPTVAVADEALVIAGRWRTVRVKACVAAPRVLVAVNVSG
jgi:hypothetical protein